MLKALLRASLIVVFCLSLLPIKTQATSVVKFSPGTLIKASLPSIYYLGADGKRYVFPTLNTYKTWYLNFNSVVTVSDEVLYNYPIGGNVTYKPGTRLIKINTDPKVYYVDKYGTLRHVTTETIAKNLWGADWYYKVDDVPDAFFTNYKLGEPIITSSLPEIEAGYSINMDKNLSSVPDPVNNSNGSIALSGTFDQSRGKVVLSWTIANMTSPQGFKVVQSTDPNPIYPGNEYHYLSDPASRNDSWSGLPEGYYHFRVCEYLGGSCGIYSNDIVVYSPGASTQNSHGFITLSGSYDQSQGKVLLNWTVTDMNLPLGFKVVKSNSLNPVYPGNDYHYLSDSASRSDYWAGLSSGTYHFRVCEYLGGACGIYSNDLAVTIP